MSAQRCGRLTALAKERRGGDGEDRCDDGPEREERGDAATERAERPDEEDDVRAEGEKAQRPGVADPSIDGGKGEDAGGEKWKRGRGEGAQAGDAEMGVLPRVGGEADRGEEEAENGAGPCDRAGEGRVQAGPSQGFAMVRPPFRAGVPDATHATRRLTNIRTP